MKAQWHNTSEKFLQLTQREQFLLLLTGVVIIFFTIFYFFIDNKNEQINLLTDKTRTLTVDNKTLAANIKAFQVALKRDQNIEIVQEISRFEAKLALMDEQLKVLTTDLISPIEMREALINLLKLEPGVSLLSFELMGAKSLLELDSSSKQEAKRHVSKKAVHGLNLYKHGIKIKLSGEYFQLRNYLQQLEQLSWKFFWKSFKFEVKEYPQGEVDITIYSLGLKKEFIGV